MRIMAVDLGDMRTGIAFSDRTCTMAGETLVVAEPNMARLATRLAEEAAAREVTGVVVGKPLNMNGTAGERAEKSQQFAALLQERSGLPVALWDERRTTVDAARILHAAGKHGKKNRGRVDAVAAALILEGYLGSLRGGA